MDSLRSHSHRIEMLSMAVALLAIGAGTAYYFYITRKPKGCLDPKTFKEFKLVKRTQLSHNVAKFRFELPTPTSVLGLPIGQHMSCRFDGCLVYCFQIHLLPDQKSEIYFSHC